jgi:hypothetical protein
LNRRRCIGECFDLVVALEGVELLRDHLTDGLPVGSSEPRVVVGETGRSQQQRRERDYEQ